MPDLQTTAFILAGLAALFAYLAHPFDSVS